jgi:hypothetical protein
VLESPWDGRRFSAETSGAAARSGAALSLGKMQPGRSWGESPSRRKWPRPPLGICHIGRAAYAHQPVRENRGAFNPTDTRSRFPGTRVHIPCRTCSRSRSRHRQPVRKRKHYECMARRSPCPSPECTQHNSLIFLRSFQLILLGVDGRCSHPARKGTWEHGRVTRISRRRLLVIFPWSRKVCRVQPRLSVGSTTVRARWG